MTFSVSHFEDPIEQKGVEVQLKYVATGEP